MPTGGFCQVCCILPGWAETHTMSCCPQWTWHRVTSRLIPDSPGWDSAEAHSTSTYMEPDPNPAPIQLSSTCTASLLSLVIRDHSPIPEDGRNHSDLWVPWLSHKAGLQGGHDRELRAWERDSCRLQSLVLGALGFLHPHGDTMGTRRGAQHRLALSSSSHTSDLLATCSCSTDDMEWSPH